MLGLNECRAWKRIERERVPSLIVLDSCHSIILLVDLHLFCQSLQSPDHFRQPSCSLPRLDRRHGPFLILCQSVLLLLIGVKFLVRTLGTRHSSHEHPHADLKSRRCASFKFQSRTKKKSKAKRDDRTTVMRNRSQ